jgi:hypothetical protein
MNYQVVNDLPDTSPYFMTIGQCTISVMLISPCVMFLVHHTVISDVFLRFQQRSEHPSDATPPPSQTS